MNVSLTSVLNEPARYFKILEKERLVIDPPVIFCSGEMNNCIYAIECLATRLLFSEIPMYEPVQSWGRTFIPIYPDDSAPFFYQSFRETTSNKARTSCNKNAHLKVVALMLILLPYRPRPSVSQLGQ